MPSSILSSLVCVLCVVVVPAAWADHCHSYWDTNGVFHDTQECEKYCCGDCRTKYCCSDIKYNFTEEKQELCFRRSARVKRSYHVEYVGIGVPIPILVCMGLIICCVTRCCCCRCRTSKKKNPRREIIMLTTVYQPVPAATPMLTTPPPSYQESAPFTQLQPMDSFQRVSEPSAAALHSDELEELEPCHGPQSVKKAKIQKNSSISV
ncbi:protein shisa-4-like [Pundamilia nyererei]|uniref:Protein shisa-4-like n=1 Tax=Pundamilia nyererei TaxID=303518 RepID=A0A9Y6JDS2_9CICH|nr:PREDICTED: protein shisa-4-like [Pundamilia nyererei]